MSSDELAVRQLTDPRAMRALAHPTRLALLELLDREGGELLASRCGELLGLSAKVCSYHLHALAKYGFVEETGGGKGRARPWRRASRRLGFSDSPAAAPELAEAADVLLRTVVDQHTRLLATYLEDRHAYPAAWRDAAVVADTVLYLTAEELARLGPALVEITSGYADRRDDPASRPPGAKRVHLIQYGFPADPPTAER
jgi:DNA-binding transcriptional ArsR family regulator